MSSLFPVKVRVVREVAEAYLRDHQSKVDDYVREQAQKRARYRWWHALDCPVAWMSRYQKAVVRVRRSLVDDPLSHPYWVCSTRLPTTLLEATKGLDPEATAYLSAVDASFIAAHQHLTRATGSDPIGKTPQLPS